MSTDYFPHWYGFKAIALVPAIILCSSCDVSPVEDDNPETSYDKPPFEEVVPEIISYTQSNLVYRGNTGDSESDCWELTLLTEKVTVDDYGFPSGPGHVLNLMFNTVYNKSQEADLNCIAGDYTSPAGYYDMSIGTYYLGFEDIIDLPGVTARVPVGTFYGELPEGMDSKDYTYDYLQEGTFSIIKNQDGTFTISGQLSGSHYLKHHFTFTGKLDPIDRAEAEITIPNSTLTGNVDLSPILHHALLQDLGNLFWLPDPTQDDIESGKPHSRSYRAVELDIADKNVEMIYWPRLTDSKSGDILKIVFFVPYETDIAKDGIPAGGYRTVPVDARDEYGIDRDYIRPGNIVHGVKDDFSQRGGSWYMPLRKSDAGQDVLGPTYARIFSGNMIVERTGEDSAGYRISFEFYDEAGYKISGTWLTDKAIPIRQPMVTK